MSNVLYKGLDGNGVIKAPNNLIVYRRQSKSKCKCHHCRISPNTGCCTFGRCRHDQVNHFKQEVLF